MELPNEAFTDPDVAFAWMQERRRTLHDQGEEARERVQAGCSLVYTAMLVADLDVPDQGTAPAHLPDELHEKWRIAFDDYHHVDDRLAAVLDVLSHLDGADLARMGDQILRRELST